MMNAPPVRPSSSSSRRQSEHHAMNNNTRRTNHAACRRLKHDMFPLLPLHATHANARTRARQTAKNPNATFMPPYYITHSSERYDSYARNERMICARRSSTRRGYYVWICARVGVV